jgi:hypothetical protein
VLNLAIDNSIIICETIHCVWVGGGCSRARLHGERAESLGGWGRSGGMGSIRQRTILRG